MSLVSKCLVKIQLDHIKSSSQVKQLHSSYTCHLGRLYLDSELSFLTKLPSDAYFGLLVSIT